MSVLHTRPYEITKSSDICNFIYSLNQSHSRSFTFLFTCSPSHNSHQSHNLSHSPNHSINDAIIRRCTQTHNHSVLHENVLRSVIHTRPYEITKFSDICDSIYSLKQSHTHAYTYSFTHSPSQKSQINNLSHHQSTQPLPLWVISSITYSFTNSSAMHSFTPSALCNPLIHPFKQSSTLTASLPTHSITDSQRHPSTDLYSQSIPC